MVNSLTVEEFSKLVARPWLAGGEHLPLLERLIESYPYFAQARMLRVAILVRLNDVRAEAEIERAVVYAPSPRVLHDYVLSALAAPPADGLKPVPGSYFDTLERLEQQAQQSNKTLEQLAAELAEARKIAVKPDEPVAQTQANVKNIDEEDADVLAYRLAIKDGDYAGALKTLSKINLHNPKKISYFAERKRYLELLSQISANKTDN